MQLRVAFFNLFTLIAISILAQSSPSNLTFDVDKVEAKFLYNYYSQDGNHSAVTGGLGTEELKDNDFKVVLKVPVDSLRRVTFRGNVNHYTSASTDRIDSETSASRMDIRTQLYFDYEKVDLRKQRVYQFSIGGSAESDYLSRGVQFTWTQHVSTVSSFSIAGSAYFDKWVMIFPEELRNDSTVLPLNDHRNSFAISLNYVGALNSRMMARISFAPTLQQGLLTTPFHRVFFQEQTLPKVEKLPATRYKLPFSGQVNIFPVHFLILKIQGNAYWDTFGINSQSLGIESVWKINPFLHLVPFYRFYRQAESTYFAPYAAHSIEEAYFTSDFDLSGFHSHYAGGTIKWHPYNGLFGLDNSWLIRTLEIGFGRYHRSDGLQSYQVSFSTDFTVPKRGR